MQTLLESKFEALSLHISKMNTMPRQLGWVWEGDSSALDKPIRVYDAFGRLELFPLVFFSSAKVLFHEVFCIQ